MSPRRRRRSDRLQAVLLFAALGIAAAFIVSFIAGLAGDADPDSDAFDPAAEPAAIRVEVLNGAGVAGLARNATDRLRREGFDVVFYGNADTFDRDSSAVLARTTDAAAARTVARALGIPRVRVRPDSSLVLDVTVILGRDWPPVATGDEGLIQRLRGWLDRR